ncbi:MAG: disulfide bond formation protein B [Rickettsiales bacterium]|nr:disulfide bond formation protein B [Rickettsiales bacterium]
MLNAELVSCDQPRAHFLGLSMAAWNALAALGCGVFTLALLQRVRRRSKT